VIVLEHQHDDPAGLVGEWLSARGISWATVPTADPQPAPAAPAAIITLGSSHSAYAEEPRWIPRHVSLLRAALAAGTPILGICFGAQALALAGGGTVAPAARPEVGWVSPGSVHAELRGPWLAWHFDAIELPPGARELARSDDALHAYALGRSLGLQFHPEVTPAIWRSWATGSPEVVERYAGDPAEFAAGVEARAEQVRGRVFTLLDWWREWLGGAAVFGMAN
jgi:GMP synthase-like glutamine amidotransferase